jgi:hypothetical protein
VNRQTRLLAVIALSAVAAGCSGSPVPAPSAAPASPPVAPKPAVAAAVPATAAAAVAPVSPVGAIRPAQSVPLVPPAPAVPTSDAPRYENKGRRDPFESLEPTVSAKAGLAVASTKLTGIIRGHATLALVETPDGIGYILKPGDILGDGRLLEIGANSVIFAVAARNGALPTRVVLKLAAN